MLLGIKWYHFISNGEVRRQTNQPLLMEIIQARRLTLFGHIARMDDNVDADAKQILTTSPSVCIGSDHQDDRGWPGWRRCRTTSTPTGCHGLTQSTWPRTDHSGGCWWPVALRTRSGASRRRRRSSTLLTLVRVCSGCAYLGQLTVPGLCHGVIKGLLSWITETVNDDSIQKNQIS